MSKLSFANVPVKAEEHFKLYFYGAILYVMDRLVQALDSQEAVYERFPFLGGYVSELALGGLEGMTTAEAQDEWRAALLAWERAAPCVAGCRPTLPLLALAAAAGLSYAALIAWFCIGLSEEDPRFGSLFEALHGTAGQHHLTFGLLTAWDADADNGVRRLLQQLQGAGLVHISNPDAPRVDWAFVTQPLIWDAVAGRVTGRMGPNSSDLPAWLNYRGPGDLLPLAQYVLTTGANLSVARTDAGVAAGADGQAWLAHLSELLGRDEIDTLLVRGPQHNGRKTLAGGLAAGQGRGLLEVRGDVRGDDERWQIVGPLASVLDALPVVTWDLGPGETAAAPHLPAYTGPLVIVLGRTGGIRDGRRIFTVTLKMPDLDQRRAHWARAFAAAGHGAAAVVSDACLDAVVRQFRLTTGAIYRTAEMARVQALLAERVDADGARSPAITVADVQAITVADVQAATRMLNRQVLDALAQRLAPLDDWGILAADADVIAELMMLENRCRHRETLLTAVSPTLSSQLSPGVRALFSGPSGTGKTLAARLLAGSLHMDAYRLDLSAVVNKYIGETGKNLEALLSRAEELDVILLIDEGDALLTQRTNVQSSNDRYANLETNFLLQRLESFTGIVIVTTNAGDRIDAAFQRRMDVVIDFRMPEASERWSLWQLHLPPGHGVEPALLRELTARCILTGGQIRNSALHASLLALSNGGVVTSEHLREAVQREYRKMGAPCPLRNN